jgi:hypothetical protein
LGRLDSLLSLAKPVRPAAESVQAQIGSGLHQPFLWPIFHRSRLSELLSLPEHTMSVPSVASMPYIDSLAGTVLIALNCPNTDPFAYKTGV